MEQQSTKKFPRFKGVSTLFTKHDIDLRNVFRIYINEEEFQYILQNTGTIKVWPCVQTSKVKVHAREEFHHSPCYSDIEINVPHNTPTKYAELRAILQITTKSYVLFQLYTVLGIHSIMQ